ncbi:MAG: hypothetical protein OWT28_03585 [Firmicutes bacterium]|nr:hypothetical protein [Bacillota bacterium]
MAVTMEMVKKYHKHWVHCHSVYGMHKGLITHVLERGIILSHFERIEGYEGSAGMTQTAWSDDRLNGDDLDVSLQFLPVPVPVPAVPGGMFVPYGGMYGVYPLRPATPW